uniref:Uncharacterized protein n=1 Tax=Arundo donax TaxID=35708 RepID=A0A0A9EKV6_ARUDO
METNSVQPSHHKLLRGLQRTAKYPNVHRRCSFVPNSQAGSTYARTKIAGNSDRIEPLG